MESNIKKSIHPDEYRYRFSEFQIHAKDLIKQQITINQLWPKPVVIVNDDGKQFKLCYGERPLVVEELDAHLSMMINDLFRKIVVEGDNS